MIKMLRNAQKLFSSSAIVLAAMVGQAVWAAVPAEGDRLLEAKRLAKDAAQLVARKQFSAAVEALDKACANDPASQNYTYQLARALPDAAIEILDPGGQRSHRRLGQRPPTGGLARAIKLGHRAADLLLGLCSEAATTSPKRAIPVFMKPDAYGQLGRLLEKLADGKAQEPSLEQEAKSLSRKERDLRLETIEPFLRSRVRDSESFGEYGSSLFWLALNPHLGSFDPARWRRDGALVMQRWLDLAEAYNPADGSGVYSPLLYITLVTGRKIVSAEPELFESIWKRCAGSKDPVLRAYAELGHVIAGMKDERRPSDHTLVSARELREKLQNEISELPDEDVRVGTKLFGIIEETLRLILNHKEDADEYWRACQFALSQREARPGLFNTAFVVLNAKNEGEKAYQLAQAVLKLIEEKPRAFSDREREQTRKICLKQIEGHAPKKSAQ